MSSLIRRLRDETDPILPVAVLNNLCLDYGKVPLIISEIFAYEPQNRHRKRLQAIGYSLHSSICSLEYSSPALPDTAVSSTFVS